MLRKEDSYLLLLHNMSGCPESALSKVSLNHPCHFQFAIFTSYDNRKGLKVSQKKK
jgi:hypothetical protein